MNEFYIILLLFIGILIALYVLGMPVAFAMGLTSIIMLATPYADLNFEMVGRRLMFAVNSFPLLAVPFYVLLGRLMNEIELTQRIFRFAKAIVGQFRGGIGYVNVVASMIFAGMSGLAVADAAGLGRIEYQAMRDEGYDKDFAIGITGGSAVIGPILPPSVTVIIYAVIADESIGALFLGGILPGLMMGGLLMVFVYIYARRRGYGASQSFSVRELFESFKAAIWALLIPIFIIGGLLTGLFTATEAGAIAVVYTIIVGFFVYGDLTIPSLYREFQDSMIETFSLLIIVAVAGVYGLVALQLRIPIVLSQMIMDFTTTPIVIMMLFVLLFIVVGTFMSTAAAILVIVPIILPILDIAGISTLHFGIVLLIALLIGTLTPPFGILLFVLERVTDVSLNVIIRAVIPFYIPLVIVLLLVIAVPELVTYIPENFL